MLRPALGVGFLALLATAPGLRGAEKPSRCASMSCASARARAAVVDWALLARRRERLGSSYPIPRASPR
jgi:hypothetical protein